MQVEVFVLIVGYDTVVVGSTYGLSAAAQLLDQKLKVGTFGKPLNFWCAYVREHFADINSFSRSQRDQDICPTA
jgi:hypothetical protein